jgi:hypothetical protein
MSIVLLAGCKGDEISLNDGDQELTTGMNEVISDYIIQRNTDSYYGTLEQNRSLAIHCLLSFN